MCQHCDEEAAKHPKDCACGEYGCPNTTPDTMIEALKKKTIRVLRDPMAEPDADDGLYLNAVDVHSTLLAFIQLNSLVNQQAGAPQEALMGINMTCMSVLNNAGAVLTNPKQQVDMSAQSVPDTLPDGWDLPPTTEPTPEG